MTLSSRERFVTRDPKTLDEAFKWPRCSSLFARRPWVARATMPSERADERLTRALVAASITKPPNNTGGPVEAVCHRTETAAGNSKHERRNESIEDQGVGGTSGASNAAPRDERAGAERVATVAAGVPPIHVCTAAAAGRAGGILDQRRVAWKLRRVANEARVSLRRVWRQRQEPKILRSGRRTEGKTERRTALLTAVDEPGHLKRDCPIAMPGPSAASGGNHAKPLTKKDKLANLGEQMIESKSYLQVEIDGVKYAALLDSGCDLTVVPYEVAAGKPLKRTRRKLYGVGGHPVQVVGSVELEMKLGDLQLELPALVSRKIHEVMLGIDWMQRQEVQWRFGDGTVKIRDQQFTLTTRHLAQSCRRLIAMRDFRIPPRSEMNVVARFNVREGWNPHDEIRLGHGTGRAERGHLGRRCCPSTPT